MAVSGDVGDRLGTLRAQAERLALAMDSTDSVRDLPSLSRELRLTLEQIAELSDDRGAEDGVDELRARREARRTTAEGGSSAV